MPSVERDTEKESSEMAGTARDKIKPRKPIAIVRLDDLDDALKLSRALLMGGITSIEFTLTNPQAIEVVAQVQREMGRDVLVGVGTVLDAESAQASIDAGAQFLVTPAFLPEVIEVGRSRDIPVVAGAFTPTEILAAWRAGADFVKVFPAGGLGPTYIKDVLAPLPGVALVPTGGVNLDNCAAFLDAGAYTVAIGGNLVSKKIAQQKDWVTLTALARQYVEACKGLG
jgi:2-dehydro-3-deoxyphosphogluconate aldolase / (4S)-4-hydroxy-2-oxoglutarate aldolase